LLLRPVEGAPCAACAVDDESPALEAAESPEAPAGATAGEGLDTEAEVDGDGDEIEEVLDAAASFEPSDGGEKTNGRATVAGIGTGCVAGGRTPGAVLGGAGLAAASRSSRCCSSRSVRGVRRVAVSDRRRSGKAHDGRISSSLLSVGVTSITVLSSEMRRVCSTTPFTGTYGAALCRKAPLFRLARDGSLRIGALAGCCGSGRTLGDEPGVTDAMGFLSEPMVRSVAAAAGVIRAGTVSGTGGDAPSPAVGSTAAADDDEAGGLVGDDGAAVSGGLVAGEMPGGLGELATQNDDDVDLDEVVLVAAVAAAIGADVANATTGAPGGASESPYGGEFGGSSSTLADWPSAEPRWLLPPLRPMTLELALRKTDSSGPFLRLRSAKLDDVLSRASVSSGATSIDGLLLSSMNIEFGFTGSETLRRREL